MSKANRGKGTFERYNRGKGTCPVCGRTNIKATYEVEVGEKKFGDLRSGSRRKKVFGVQAVQSGHRAR